MWLFGTPLAILSRKLSIRCPAASSPTSSITTESFLKSFICNILRPWLAVPERRARWPEVASEAQVTGCCWFCPEFAYLDIWRKRITKQHGWTVGNQSPHTALPADLRVFRSPEKRAILLDCAHHLQTGHRLPDVDHKKKSAAAIRNKLFTRLPQPYEAL